MNLCYQFVPKNVALIFHTFMIVYWMVYSCCAEYIFVTEPQSSLFKEGETAFLTCAWTPTLDDEHILRWVIFLQNGTAVFVLDNSIPHYTLSNTLETSHLNISKFSSSDVGRYRCEVGGSKNLWISNDAYVGEIGCYPSDYDGELGVTPRCYSSLSPVDLHWFRNGILLNTKPHGSNILNSIALTVEDDGAVFTCQAKYGQDSPIIGTCEITPLVLSIDAQIVKSPPGSVALTDNFNLTCLVKGDPDKYSYAWTYNGELVDATTTGKRYAIGDKNNILTFRDSTDVFNGKIVKCTVSRQDRESVVIPYEIVIKSDVQITTQTTIINTLTTTGNNRYKESDNSPATSMIFILLLAIIVIILAISLVCILIKKRGKKNKKKTDTVSSRLPDDDEVEYSYPTLPGVDIAGTKESENIEYDYATFQPLDDFSAPYDDVELPRPVKTESVNKDGEKFWSINGLLHIMRGPPKTAKNKIESEGRGKTTVELNPLYGQV